MSNQARKYAGTDPNKKNQMSLTALAMKYKGVVIVTVVLAAIFGYRAISDLPLQLLPNIERPQITIWNNWRSAAPEEVEEAIIQPQEEVLQYNAGVEDIISGTSRGQGRVVLNYQLGFDMSQALLDVVNRLNQAPPLPGDAGEPFVANGGDNGLPGAASVLVFAGENNPVKDMIEYQQLIEDVVEPRLARIPGVAQVNLDGRRPRELRVTINPLRMAMLGYRLMTLPEHSSGRVTSQVVSPTLDAAAIRYVSSVNRRYPISAAWWWVGVTSSRYISTMWQQ